MRIVFMGSAELACPSLDVVAASEADELVAGVTQPDRPKGRHLRTAPCPAKAHAESLGLATLAPANVNSEDSLSALRRLSPDLVVVVAYGQILRSPLLALPPLGCVNIHSSLLPRYRGAAPIQWAIARGDDTTGVTSMVMNERMDAGDIIFQSRLPIGPGETAGELHDRVAAAGAALLHRTLEAVRNGNAPRTPQDEAKASLAPKLRRSDGRIRWTMKATDIYNRIRGFNPWPGSYCLVPFGDGRHRVKVFKAAVEEPEGEPGRVLDTNGPGPLVAAGNGSVRLLEVQPEGGRRMAGDEYLRGHTLKTGDSLDPS